MMQSQTTVFMGDRVPFCPKAKLDDGLIDLVLVKHGDRLTFVSSIESAKKNEHLGKDNFVYVQTSGYTLTPTTVEQSGKGTLNIDGELIGSTPFQVRCLKRHVSFIVATN